MNIFKRELKWLLSLKKVIFLVFSIFFMITLFNFWLSPSSESYGVLELLSLVYGTMFFTIIYKKYSNIIYQKKLNVNSISNLKIITNISLAVFTYLIIMSFIYFVVFMVMTSLNMLFMGDLSYRLSGVADRRSPDVINWFQGDQDWLYLYLNYSIIIIAIIGFAFTLNVVFNNFGTIFFIVFIYFVWTIIFGNIMISYYIPKDETSIVSYTEMYTNSYSFKVNELFFPWFQFGALSVNTITSIEVFKDINYLESFKSLSVLSWRIAFSTFQIIISWMLPSALLIKRRILS